jgi:butyryl-CoA dehydrogenase
MDFALSPELIDLRTRVRALVDDHLIRYETEAEEHHGRLSPESHARIKQAVLDSGLAANNIPKEFGGGGFSLTEQIVTHEQLGRLTNCLWVLVWSPSNVLVHGTPEQIERYLLPDVRGEHRHAYAITEEAAGSDPRAIAAEAVWNGDHYELSGTKWFVTDGDVASYFIVLAWAVDGHDRRPALFLVDKDLPGVRVNRVPRYTHTFVYEHPEFGFEGVRVGADAVLGEIGGGYDLTRDWFTEERLMIAARTIGAAERALALATDWAQQREQGGARLIEHQMIKAMLADSAAEIAINRAYTHQVAWEFDQGGDRKTLHAKAAMTKLAASEASGRVVDRAVQIFGGRGYMREQPVERLYRELRVDRIWEGTSEIQRLVIANELDKRGLDGLVSFAREAAPATA